MRVAVFAVVALAACGNETTRAPAETAPPAPKVVPATTAELLGAMAMLTGHVPEPAWLDEWNRKIHASPAALDRYIDELLANERFANEIIPSLVFGSFVNVRNYYAVPSAFVLKQDDPKDPLYLRSPCAVSDAVRVQPWWDLESEVRVCPDAYRPKKWTLDAGEHSYRTPTVLACDSQVGSPEAETHPLCGCGPNLIRCMRDEDQYNELNISLMEEVKRTAAYVVERDLPMSTLFTANATFRDRAAELYYRRQKIGALQIERVAAELADLDAWPEDGTWAPRHEVRPGQHAGVLTAPQILHWLPDRRQRQRAYYEIMWCSLKNTFGATTQKVLEINASGNNFFAHDSWKQLAHTELCTTCHARLDYGFQFFLGYPDSRASTHFVPSLHGSGTGPLYGSDIGDLRGHAELTPAAFAGLATTQPEFATCMTNQFVSYVLGDRGTPDDTRAVAVAVATDGTFKSAMRAALHRYAAKRFVAEPKPAEPALSPMPQLRATARNTPEPRLRAALDERCSECHAHGDDIDLTREPLPRELLVRMADQVASGLMPKDQLLEPQVREDLVGLLIDALALDPAAAAEARRYYLGRRRGIPAHQIDNALATIHHIAGASSEIHWGALERGIWSEQATITPGFIAVSALDALRACARASVGLEECLLDATSLPVLSRQPQVQRTD